MSENGWREKKVEEEFMNLLMEMYMRDIGLLDKDKEEVDICGKMGSNMLENGNKIK